MSENSINSNAYVSEEYDHLLRPYFKLLLSNFVSVRLQISKNILSFSNHIKSFNNNEIARIWFSYVEDENFEIRSNIARVIKRLLLNKINISKFMMSIENENTLICLDEFVESFINIIAHAVIKALTNSNHALHDTLLVTAKNCAWYDIYLKNIYFNYKIYSNFVIFNFSIPLHIIERYILNIFLITIVHSTSSSAAIAFATTAYHDIAKFLNVSPKVLYIRYKKNFLKVHKFY